VKDGNGRSFCPAIPNSRHFGIFYMLQICDMGQTALLPLRRKACCGFFRPKNPTASAGFEPAMLTTRPLDHRSRSYTVSVGGLCALAVVAPCVMLSSCVHWLLWLRVLCCPAERMCPTGQHNNWSVTLNATNSLCHSHCVCPYNQ
jgi:hypothetical protein